MQPRMNWRHAIGLSLALAMLSSTAAVAKPPRHAAISHDAASGGSKSHHARSANHHKEVHARSSASGTRHAQRVSSGRIASARSAGRHAAARIAGAQGERAARLRAAIARSASERHASRAHLRTAVYRSAHTVSTRSRRLTDTARPQTSRSETSRYEAARYEPSRYEMGSDREIGTASWYGGIHLGQRTASGAVLDEVTPTAAHRSLPMNSLARVTNLKNGRSVIVTVNDRGPSSRGRLIDVSAGAAEELDMKRDGVVSVSVEPISHR